MTTGAAIGRAIAATPKLSTKPRRKRRKPENIATFRQLMEVCETYDMPRAWGVSSSEALQEVLERTVAFMRAAAMMSDQVPHDEWWVEKMDAQGNILVEPNKWIQLEGALRAEVAEIALRMEQHGIEDRRVAVAERFAEALAPVLEGMLKELKLTPKQRERAPEVIHRHLALLEPGGGS